MLIALGVVFYCSALLCAVLGIASIGSDGPLLAAVLFGGVVSNLFFGAMCFAISRGVDLLAVIADNTMPVDDEGDGAEDERSYGGDSASPVDDPQHCSWCDRSITPPHKGCSDLTGRGLKMKDPGRYNDFCRVEVERRGGLTDAARQLDGRQD